MPFSVRLGPDTEAILTRLARRSGRTKSDVVREAVHRMAAEEESRPGESLRDTIADLIGIARGADRHYAARSEEVLRSLLQPRSRKKS